MKEKTEENNVVNINTGRETEALMDHEYLMNLAERIRAEDPMLRDSLEKENVCRQLEIISIGVEAICNTVWSLHEQLAEETSRGFLKRLFNIR